MIKRGLRFLNALFVDARSPQMRFFLLIFYLILPSSIQVIDSSNFFET